MAKMIQIKDFYGKILGYIETLPNGDKVLRNLYRKILGRYNKATDTTRNFYGQIIAKGDQLTMLLNMNK